MSNIKVQFENTKIKIEDIMEYKDQGLHCQLIMIKKNLKE